MLVVARNFDWVGGGQTTKLKVITVRSRTFDWGEVDRNVVGVQFRTKTKKRSSRIEGLILSQ